MTVCRRHGSRDLGRSTGQRSSHRPGRQPSVHPTARSGPYGGGVVDPGHPRHRAQQPGGNGGAIEENAGAEQNAVASEKAAAGVEANARLTALTAVVLFVLLVVEGVTVLRVRQLLTLHVFIGMLLVPPVLLKMGSTGYRFVRYYTGTPAYRRKGPPPALLRVMGPFVVFLTVILFASGILLLLRVGPHGTLLLLHKASFVLWFGVMAIHVIGHLAEMVRLAPKDFSRPARRVVPGSAARKWALLGSLGIGVLLAWAFTSSVGTYLAR
jgi:hypothetical protein